MHAFHTVTFDSSDMEDIPAGYTVEVEFSADEHWQGLPWNEFDGHGIIRDVFPWGRPEKRPGERPIFSERGTTWLYDVQETMKKARAEGWRLAPEEMGKLAAKLKREPTKGEILARAVALDMDYCAGWLTGRYSWCVVTARVCDADGDEVSSDSVAGVEWDAYGDNSYAEKETARDVAANALHEAGLTLKQRREAWRAALREAREARALAARGVLTLGA